MLLLLYSYKTLLKLPKKTRVLNVSDQYPNILNEPQMIKIRNVNLPVADKYNL